MSCTAVNSSTGCTSAHTLLSRSVPTACQHFTVYHPSAEAKLQKLRHGKMRLVLSENGNRSM